MAPETGIGLPRICSTAGIILCMMLFIITIVSVWTSFMMSKQMQEHKVLNVLNLLNTFNIENPNTMILQFFFQGKTQELIKIFSKATPPDKAKALEFLKRLDVSSASQYQDQLK